MSAWTGRKNIDRWFRCADATAAKEHPLSFAFTPAEQPFLELLLGFKFTGGGNVSVAGETGPAVVDRGDGCLLAGRVAFLLSDRPLPLCFGRMRHGKDPALGAPPESLPDRTDGRQSFAATTSGFQINFLVPKRPASGFSPSLPPCGANQQHRALENTN